MKEATGELNMTVIAVVAIAAVGAFFTIVIWPRIKSSLSNSTDCANAVCTECSTEPSTGDRKCSGCTSSDGEKTNMTCTYKAADNTNN